jgi:hypothetical protein
MLQSHPSSGLGMYPDETCFDVSRPSWLPYWIDDFAESSCKLNLLFSGNPTGNTIAASQLGASLTTIQNTQQSCINGGGSWDSAQNICTPSVLGQYGPWLIGGVAAIALLLFVAKR